SFSIFFFFGCICEYFGYGCHYYYEKAVHSFTYSKTYCGKFISMYLEFGINLAFVFFVVIADTLTVIKLKVSSNVSFDFFLFLSTHFPFFFYCFFFFVSLLLITPLGEGQGV
ncbi:unnamed protein product, partial [Enterobius vermicularis]|uniref:7TM_GPCR_Srx domain-containing protein n=1 Tax=Enterobius vermicularis TaxID=51028 RepID=A0A0N4VMU3_ENTVE